MLKRISPTKLIFYSFLSWFLAYLIIPAHYIVNGSRLYPVFVFVGYNICLLIGFFSVKQKKQYQIPPTRIDYFTIKIAYYIGIIGFVLQFIQLVFIDKILSANAIKVRLENQLTEFNSGFMGIIIALTFPFAIVAFLAIFYNYKWSTTRMKIISSLFALLYIGDAYLNNARLPIAVIGFIAIIVFLFYKAHKDKFLKKDVILKLQNTILFRIPKIFLSYKTVLVVFILLGCLTFFKNAMVKRLEYYSYEDVLSYWETQHESKINNDFKRETNLLNKTEKNRAVATYSLYHYFVHAPFEFQKLVNHVDEPLGTYYGKYELDVYFKLLRFFNIPIESRMEMEKILYHEGYYITLWGPFYLDFGLFGFFIAILIGHVIKKTYLLASRGHFPAILMYSYFAVVLLASFHVSLVGSKYLYIFNAILCYWLMNSFFKSFYTYSLKQTTPC